MEAPRHSPWKSVQQKIKNRSIGLLCVATLLLHPAQSYGHIAQLWSTYEVRPTRDGKPEVRGINSIQAVYDGQNWKVLQIVWQAETPALPIPAEYLP